MEVSQSPTKESLGDSATVTYANASLPKALATGAKKQTVIYVRGDGIGWGGTASHHPKSYRNHHPKQSLEPNDLQPHADENCDTRPTRTERVHESMLSISVSCSVLCAEFHQLCCRDLVVVCCLHLRAILYGFSRFCERMGKLWCRSERSGHLWTNFALLFLVMSMLWAITGLAWMKFSDAAYEK